MGLLLGVLDFRLYTRRSTCIRYSTIPGLPTPPSSSPSSSYPVARRAVAVIVDFVARTFWLLCRSSRPRRVHRTSSSSSSSPPPSPCRCRRFQNRRRRRCPLPSPSPPPPAPSYSSLLIVALVSSTSAGRQRHRWRALGTPVCLLWSRNDGGGSGCAAIVVAAQQWRRSDGAQRWQRRWRRSDGDDGTATA